MSGLSISSIILERVWYKANSTLFRDHYTNSPFLIDMTELQNEIMVSTKLSL
jgi:hypothetical protein